MKNFVVEYELDYTHRVQVGITASTKEAASRKAERLFDAGALWDDTKDVPVLYDDFEEVDSGRALEFNVVDTCKAYPKPGACVFHMREEAAAKDAVKQIQRLCSKAKARGENLTPNQVLACLRAAANRFRVGEQSVFNNAVAGLKVAA